MDSILAEIDTSVDDFDAVPSRKSRKKEVSPKSETSPVSNREKKDAEVEKQKVKEVERKVVKQKVKVEEQRQGREGTETADRDRAALVYSRPSESRYW